MILVVDPLLTPIAGCVPLFRAASEQEQALALLDRRGVLAGLPYEVLVHLHTGELVERAREAERAEAELRGVVVPFWPPALFVAGEVVAHAAREMLALLADPEEVRVVEHDAPTLVAAAGRWIGVPHLDPEGYVRALRSEARRCAWTLMRAPVPERATASGLLGRDGRILLERRPADAPVTPGVWDSPGGHLEAGELAEEALLRELREELGITVEGHRLLAIQDERAARSGERYRHFVYGVRAWLGEPTALEGRPLRWLTAEEALALPDLNPRIGEILLSRPELGSRSP